MKKVVFLHTCSFLALLLAGTFSTASCMDEAFEPTGKKYSDDKWYLLDDSTAVEVIDELKKKYPDPGEKGLQRTLMTGGVDNLKNFFETNVIYPLSQPSILQGSTARSGLRFYYPLEYAIHCNASVEIINQLIKLGAPVKNYKGYDPLLHILSKYYTDPDITHERLTLAEQYLTTLVANGATPYEQPLYTKRTYDQHYFQGSDTPMTCIQKLINGLQRDLVKNKPVRHGDKWEKITNEAIKKLKTTEIKWKTLLTKLTTDEASKKSSIVNSPIAKPPLPSTSTVPQGALLPNSAAGQPKVSWTDTVSRWCNNAQSGSAKTPICIVAIAVTAVASRLLYKTLFKQHTTPPAQITIFNDTDTSITLAYKTNTSTHITSISLRPKQEWLVDINNIKLDILVMQLETVQAPLAINLNKYKASAHQNDQSLRIAILKSSPIRYLLFKIPYTYSVEWTSDK